MEKRGLMTKVLPWLLIVFGFLTLNMFQGYLALTCMVIGFVMIIERIWPEKLDSGNEILADK